MPEITVRQRALLDAWTVIHEDRMDRTGKVGPFPGADEPEQRCSWLRAMDHIHGTYLRSPMHHDQRCPIHKEAT